MKKPIGLFTALQAAVFGLSILTDWFGPLCLLQLAILILLMLDKLGKGILLREIVALHSTFICLVMPLMGYNFFPKTNPLARLWVRYMPIPEPTYFHFALPAISGFVLCLLWPDAGNSDEGQTLRSMLVKARDVAQHKPMIGVYLLAAGTVMFWFSSFVPDALYFIFLLFFFSAFAGFLYVYFAEKFKGRVIYLTIFAIFILVTAATTGMFTVVAYMTLTLFSFFFLGRKTPLWKKAMWFVVGAYVLILIQAVKPAFRIMTWEKRYEGNKAALFADLMLDKLTNMDWTNADAFFPIYYRTNQGFNVSLVMRRFPNLKPYDNGANLSLVVVSAFVPRILWPDKPEAGGKFNMQYYTGIYISGWSTNIGPLGEAYGSFGPIGGVIYMMALGLFIRWVYFRVFRVARKIPMLIFWLPVMFYQCTYSAETDTLQILNSLVKSAFFVFLLYKILPDLFVVRKKLRQRPHRAAPDLLKLSDPS